jgi:hemoglobin/transferrin/lactoferrin receptor protein
LYNGEEVITQANKNLGDRFIHGGSLEGKWMLRDFLALRGGITYTTADQNSNYGPMPSIAPLFGTFTLSNEIKKLKTLLIWKFSKAKDPIDFSWGGEDGLNETPLVNPSAAEDINRYFGMPSWNVWSILSQYQFRKNISFNLGLKNIFDLHYRTFASGISSEGRSLQLGVKVKI